jgi:hypothetical protein
MRVPSGRRQIVRNSRSYVHTRADRSCDEATRDPATIFGADRLAHDVGQRHAFLAQRPSHADVVGLDLHVEQCHRATVKTARLYFNSRRAGHPR